MKNFLLSFWRSLTVATTLAPAAASTLTLIEKKSGPWMLNEVEEFLKSGCHIWRSGGNKIATFELPTHRFLYRALDQKDASSFTVNVVPVRGPEMKAFAFGKAFVLN